MPANKISLVIHTTRIHSKITDFVTCSPEQLVVLTSIETSPQEAPPFLSIFECIALSQLAVYGVQTAPKQQTNWLTMNSLTRLALRENAPVLHMRIAAR